MIRGVYARCLTQVSPKCSIGIMKGKPFLDMDRSGQDRISSDMSEVEEKQLEFIMGVNGKKYKGMVKRMIAQGATVEQIQQAIDRQTDQTDK